MKDKKDARLLKKRAPAQIIVISFMVVILIGAVLLTLPISARHGDFTNPVDALFTATSATCVTGLSVYDTTTYWSPFGQAVILILIQIGGLGLATFATGFSLLFGRRLGINELILARESANGSSLDVASLLRIVISITFFCETMGAAILMLRFVPEYGTAGIWPAVFVSVSAFCNAGFDILGFIPNNTSLTAFNGDPLVTLTICFLIIFGSIGFVVFNDVYVKKIRARFVRDRRPIQKLGFHAQICLRMTAFLLVAGTLLILLFEFNNETMAGMSFFEKLNAAFIQSVNTRTAGFASIDLVQEQEATKLVTIILMFIGGCPGSTAGGIKVTTVTVLVATVVSTLRGGEEATLRRHRFDKSLVYKTLSVVAIGLLVVFIDILLIAGFNPQIPLIDAAFEAFSAFGTVGVSANVTPQLELVSKIAVLLTMFIGRLGPVSLGVAILTKKKKKIGTVLPTAHVLIG